jgi:hypothetical protein
MRNLLLTLWYKYKSWRWEQKCIKYFGAKPEKVYVSKEAYDELVRRINEPPDPAVVERFKQIMSKPAPWDDNCD